MSIKLRLIIVFSLSLLLACGGIGAISFFRTKTAAEESFHALAIRRLERVSEERDNCFKAGMCAQAAKPIDVQELYAILTGYEKCKGSE